MNVWAIKKNNAIRRLLLAVEGRFGTESLRLSNRWDNNENAVGLYQQGEESLLAYVYTYGQAEGKYGLHVEYPDEQNFTLSAMDENLDLRHVLDLLTVHLNLEPHTVAA